MRDRFSARRHVAEKYYDCLQCAEQCRHADNGNPSGGGNNNNNYSNNNNGKNDGGAVGRRIRDSYRLPATSAELYLDEEASPDELRRIRSARSISLGKSLARHQPAHLTPVKKRSSLARPVRVHDSFVQPRRPMAEENGYHQDDPQRGQQTKNPWWWERRDHQEPNTSSYAYHRDTEDGSAGWPIRLRLEQMLELTLPQTKRRKKKKKKKKTATATATMMLMKQQQRGRHSFKDTEKLLKVLSINNVDQDNRYNVKRCSVM
ncbi:PREDICTED: myb-like protein AA [Wasmannia auropunctata]|uniref:myb-like protein AA n=1 Tax=Wasmannia auropunctata TaxID=64793 RepID=UPI0005F0B346|nr:PREDICTED: myb-like protein AA [Wasmannia auropunctata]